MAVTQKGFERDRATDGNMIASQAFAQCFRAYLECSNEVQTVIREMVEVASDPNTEPDERDMAHQTISEALFPSNHGKALGIDLEHWDKIEATTTHIQREMDREEATFAERLARLMEEKGVTQAELASAISIQQPAVSMMLSRNCRPQRRTVEKIARALQVSPEELWPGIKGD